MLSKSTLILVDFFLAKRIFANVLCGLFRSCPIGVLDRRLNVFDTFTGCIYLMNSLDTSTRHIHSLHPLDAFWATFWATLYTHVSTGAEFRLVLEHPRERKIIRKSFLIRTVTLTVRFLASNWREPTHFPSVGRALRRVSYIFTNILCKPN